MKPGDRVEVSTNLDSRGYFIGKILRFHEKNTRGISWVIEIIDHQAQINMGAEIEINEYRMKLHGVIERTIREIMI